MALYQATFSPRYGFDFNTDLIGKYTANGAIEYGKIVSPDGSDVLTVANDYGYFLMERITTDGPTMLEIVLGDFQFDVKTGVPVSVLIPKKGAIVRTVHVIKGAAGAEVAAGQKCDIVNGVYETVAANAGTKGLVKAVVTDSLGNTLYDVEIL